MDASMPSRFEHVKKALPQPRTEKLACDLRIASCARSPFLSMETGAAATDGMSETPGHGYRERARHCERLASESSDPDVKQRFLEFAARWHELADAYQADEEE